MQVKDILKAKERDLISARKHTTIPEAMNLLISNKISCLPVLSEKDELVGIISDKDIFYRVHADPQGFTKARVGDLMTEDVIVGLPDDEVAYIAGIMTNNRIRHIPIVDQGRLTGLISVGDVVKTQMEAVKIENRYLKQYIDGNYPG
ncbi:CBS domain-containing protein [candidate division GN15 bacterium]|nr:CBS domain-containing protein [candidate division GN15 bacterium]